VPRRKKKWLDETYLPFLNEYKNFPAYFNPRYLDTRARQDLERDAAAMARFLLAFTDDATLDEFKLTRTSSPRDICRRLIFTDRHFTRYWTASGIESSFLPLRTINQLQALYTVLLNQTERNITADGGVNAAYYKSTYNTVMNRLEAFLRPPLSYVLGSSSFSFEDVMNATRPRILFINLSKLRGQQAHILGQLIIALIQQTLQRREQMSEYTRAQRPIMTYIDEFALFATSEQALVDLFARGRKYRMACAVFHQTTSDLPASFLDVIIGNVGSQIIMQLAAADASYFAKELQLTEFDELKARRLREQEAAKLERETRRIFRETSEHVDLLADPMDVHRIQKKIQDYSSGGLMPALLQNLKIGQAIVKTPMLLHGVGTRIPYLEDPDTRRYDPRSELIARSKRNYGKPLELRRSKTEDATPTVAPSSTPSTTEQDDDKAELIL
jgi:hypothetical protein